MQRYHHQVLENEEAAFVCVGETGENAVHVMRKRRISFITIDPSRVLFPFYSRNTFTIVFAKPSSLLFNRLDALSLSLSLSLLLFLPPLQPRNDVLTKRIYCTWKSSQRFAVSCPSSRASLSWRISWHCSLTALYSSGRLPFRSIFLRVKMTCGASRVSLY